MQDRFTAKRVDVRKDATSGKTGVGVFFFIDSYSVFDYGIMPDALPGKGQAMAKMAAYNFELLESHGIPTHFRKFLGGSRIEFDLLNVFNPHVEPIALRSRAYFIPLQIVFRNTLPSCASVFRRLSDGDVSLQDFGWRKLPEPGEALATPMIEYMTKLENLDRYISRQQAQEIAALSDDQIEKIENTVRRTSAILRHRAAQVGLELADAKLEFGIGEDGDPILVDVAGTPDESRFLLDGYDVSKQVLRKLNEVSEFKTSVHSWANSGRNANTKPTPEPLRPAVVQWVSDMYRTLSDRWMYGVEAGDTKLEELAVKLSRAASACEKREQHGIVEI